MNWVNEFRNVPEVSKAKVKQCLTEKHEIWIKEIDRWLTDASETSRGSLNEERKDSNRSLKVIQKLEV